MCFPWFAPKSLAFPFGHSQICCFPSCSISILVRVPFVRSQISCFLLVHHISSVFLLFATKYILFSFCTLTNILFSLCVITILLFSFGSFTNMLCSFCSNQNLLFSFCYIEIILQLFLFVCSQISCYSFWLAPKYRAFSFGASQFYCGSCCSLPNLLCFLLLSPKSMVSFCSISIRLFSFVLSQI